MPDLMAIISKAVFEKAAGKAPALGTQLRMDRYVSANKQLERLAEGGKLYLVTVRPPEDTLWLVAVLDRPVFDGTQWIAAPCTTPLTSIDHLKASLRFESGKPLPTGKGTLGMSLQTPRVLAAEDVVLLERTLGAADADAAPSPPPGEILATGAGNRRALLLAAVLADPANLDARQVYADALSAAGDPRGELIQLDIALDGRLSIRKREELQRQRDNLLHLHAKTWWPERSVRPRITKGFVEAVHGTLATLEAAAALFEREPIFEVDVRGLRDVDSVARLLAAPWLPRARRLAIRGKLGDEGFAALLASPAIAHLESLNVTGNRLGAPAMAALQDRLPRCKTLVLSRNSLDEGAITGLAKWRHLGTLETLYLGRCGLTAAGVQTLLGTPLPRLGKLALAGNRLGPSVGATIAARASHLPALHHLDLSKTGLTTPGATELAQALPNTRLDLRGNRVERTGVVAEPRIRT